MKVLCIVSLSLLGALAFAPACVLAGEDVDAVIEEAADASVAARLEDARRRLDEAAREVAELSAEHVKASFGAARMHRGALGVVLAPGSKNALVVAGVTPGGGAAKAGLVAGDVIVAINGVAVDVPEPPGSIPTLLRALDDVEPGDTVRVDYERDGAAASVDVITQEHPPFAMGAMGLTEPPPIDFLEAPPHEEPMMFTRRIEGRPLMLHDLDETLGHYFGVSEGVLVLSAPEGEQGFEAGDIVKSVAGTPVTSTAATYHALMGLKDDAAVEVLRDGGLVTVQVKPGTGPGLWTMPFAAGRQIRSVRVIRKDGDGEGTGEADVNVDVIVHEE